MSGKEWHHVSCSGGKDSTALAIGMWERGYQIDEIVAADEGMWWPEAYQVLEQITAITGIPVTIIQPAEDKRFEYLMFDKVLTRGARAGLKGYGWPSGKNRWCTEYCKAQQLDAHIAQKENEGFHVISYIGIAADEAHRADKNSGSKTLEKRYPLIDWGMTEADCLEFCGDHGIDFGGLYDHFNRLSCWCCPLMSLRDARSLYHFYPEKWERLKDMDARARNQFKPAWSVQALEDRFRLEDELGEWQCPLCKGKLAITGRDESCVQAECQMCGYSIIKARM